MKLKSIMAIVTVVLNAATFSVLNAQSLSFADANKPKGPITAAARFAQMSESEREERKKAIQRKVMEQHGGILERKGVGAMAVVNCQKRADISSITPKLNDFRKASRMDIMEVTGMFKLQDVKIPEGACIAVFIVDDPSLPASLIALESKWGMMNIAALLSDTPDSQTAQKRIIKQFIRVASLTFGGGCSQYSGSPLQPAFNNKQLDAIRGEGLTIDIVKSMSRNLTTLGMKPSFRATYRKACEEGWAPAPTNEYQKVIWEQVKADKERGPTNPIEIPMPRKK
jgi:hypothetical protein